MTQADTQLMALRSAHSRVLEVLMMMTPLIERLAGEGDPVAGYLISEYDKAQDVLATENLSAREFIAENENTP